MKTFPYAAAAAVACLATQSSAYDETTVCPISETAKLLALASNQYLNSCQTASSYSFVPPSAYPTETQVLLMCLTPDCHSLIDDLLDLKPADCVINFGTVSINVLQLAESFQPNCTALGL
ncbi:Elicitin [Phytophthora infestans]|uniref:Elicitin n=1 Tax=Phytophthora infestans TaxID=4787 RepID=A0A8S9UNU0_PHYIN|nr:Elicitin [Phytophthora infestans]KAI9986477.1 hypothetical protein PInf_025420 [Phytophthora infestans]